MGGGIDPAPLVASTAGQASPQDAEEGQGALPVDSPARPGTRPSSRSSLDLLGLQLVQKAGELAGEADRLVVEGLALGLGGEAGRQEPRQKELAADRRQRRRGRQLGSRHRANSSSASRSPTGAEARQQHRAALAQAKEGVAQRQAGAAAGQEDEMVGEALRAPRLISALGKIVEERPMRGNGEDASHGGTLSGRRRPSGRPADSQRRSRPRAGCRERRRGDAPRRGRSRPSGKRRPWTRPAGRRRPGSAWLGGRRGWHRLARRLGVEPGPGGEIAGDDGLGDVGSRRPGGRRGRGRRGHRGRGRRRRPGSR